MQQGRQPLGLQERELIFIMIDPSFETIKTVKNRSTDLQDPPVSVLDLELKILEFRLLRSAKNSHELHDELLGTLDHAREKNIRYLCDTQFLWEQLEWSSFEVQRLR